MAVLAASRPWFMAATTGERIVAFARVGKPLAQPFLPAFAPLSALRRKGALPSCNGF
jgi:hypothetical protein